MSMVRANYASDATIAINAATSGAIPCGEFTSGGFQIPAAFTGASVSFQGSYDGTTYVAVYNSSNSLISITVAASRGYPLPAEVLAFRFFKIVSASNEAAARTIGVSMKG